MMPVNSTGMISKRDSMAFQSEKNAVKKIVMDIIQLSIDEIVYKYPLSSWQSRDGKVEYVKASVMKFGVDDKRFIKTLYRPFDIRWTYYTPESKGFVAWPVNEVMQHLLLGENLGLITCRQQSQRNLAWGLVGVTNLIMESCAISNKTKEINTLFPLYLYPTEKDNFVNGNGNGHHNTLARTPNFSESFVRDLETRLNLQLISEGHGDFQKTISALDVFNYMYAIFHSPTYRQRYAEFLKLDFPRLPLIQNTVLFKQLAELGEQLVKIHLMAADIENDCCFPIKGSNVVEKVIYKENRVYINTTQYFDYVTAEIWAFHIGGYQVCEKWLKDRKGKTLGFEECSQYLYILAAVEWTQSLMKRIDELAQFPL
jgi:predicted helicase